MRFIILYYLLIIMNKTTGQIKHVKTKLITLSLY